MNSQLLPKKTSFTLDRLGIYRFVKSGSVVRYLSQSAVRWQGVLLAEVERVDSGKRMLVPPDSLVPFSDSDCVL